MKEIKFTTNYEPVLSFSDWNCQLLLTRSQEKLTSEFCIYLA